MKWTYANLFCSKTRETYINSFTKHYITLSASLLNYNWALNATIKNDASVLVKVGTTEEINLLFSKLRDGSSQNSWLKQQGWGTDSSGNVVDPSCDVLGKVAAAAYLGATTVSG